MKKNVNPRVLTRVLAASAPINTSLTVNEIERKRSNGDVKDHAFGLWVFFFLPVFGEKSPVCILSDRDA